MTTLTQRRALAPDTDRPLARWIDTYRKWSNARATRAALYKLSERELGDIGLTRGDIDQLTAWR